MNRIRARNELSLPRRQVLRARWSKLSPEEQQTARQAIRIFKQNPFDLRLRTHKIHRLSAHYGRTLYAVDLAGDLRCAFYLEAETVWSVSSGTHDIYQG
jgi:hypothetical protein